MTISSLEDLNIYSLTPITYNDVRPAQVFFDRGATVPQSLTISENFTYNFPWGINIEDITQFDVALVEYVIDLSNHPEPVSVTWPFLPSYMTVTRVNNTWTVSGLRNRQDWLWARAAQVQPPFGFTGLITHTGSITFFADSAATTRTVATWTVSLTVTAVEYFDTAPAQTYVSNENKINFPTTSIIVNPDDFDPVWTLRIFASDKTIIDEIFSDGTPAEASWNNTTKEFTITGASVDVNDVLSTLDIDFARTDADFELRFLLANNFTSQIEQQVQIFSSRDFISDQTSVFTQAPVTLNVRWGGRFDHLIRATIAPTPNVIRGYEADLNSVATSITTANARFSQRATANSNFGIVPNGGYLLEMAPTTLSSEFTTVNNVGFLLEDSAVISSTAQLQSWPIKHKDAMVFTLDQTKLSGWTGLNDANYRANNIEVTTTGSYNVYWVGSSGATSTAFNDAYNQPNISVIVEPIGTNYGSVEIRKADNQMLSLDAWGAVNSYDIELSKQKNLQSISRVGPLIPAAGPGLFNAINNQITPLITAIHTHANDLFVDIQNLDVSNFTSMQGFFLYSDFNLDISHWNTSNVTDMSSMFASSRFNQPINNWNTSNVTDMSYMFAENPFFNQDLNSWNTSSVTNMTGMFYMATAFDGDISSWDTSNVTAFGTPTSIRGMFGVNLSEADQAIQGLATPTDNTTRKLRFGETSIPLDQRFMKFNRNISGWNTSSAVDMTAMFAGNRAFNQNISSWNTANVNLMNSMFAYAVNFNQPIGSWNTGSVTQMEEMFKQAVDFNQNLNTWNTSNVTTMRGMFSGQLDGYLYEYTGTIDLNKFNGNITAWNTSNVTDMVNMFNGNKAFDQNISGWCVQQIPSKPSGFDLNTNTNWTTAEKPNWGAPC